MIRNIKLTIEYDGTNYLGWQSQKRGPTIQETIENALKKITKDTVKIVGSGRTDTGVHAIGQVANFKTESNISPLQIQKALNSILPNDIVITYAGEVDVDFHAQFDAKSKKYIYRILNRPFPSALERIRAWYISFPLKINKMDEAAKLLLGEKDYKAFGLSTRNLKSTVRNVIRVNLDLSGNHILEFEIESTGFLKRMVRLVVGTLIQVGKEKITPNDFGNILDSGERTKFVRAAPPWGLYLKEVKY